MKYRDLFARLNAAVRSFVTARNGNVAVVFGIAAVPLMIGVGAAVDYSHANSVKTAMQAALDSTALALVKTASSSTSTQLTESASSFFAATFNRPEAQNISISAQYDTSSGILSVTGSGTMPTSFVGLIGMSTMSVSGTSKATMAGRLWPVCVVITNDTQKHTLFTQDTAQINFDNCMVQVNTTDWDAVEARNSSYIHSTNGENCFVGQIHYGDVLPPKDPSCTFLPDPFAGYAMPASASNCDYTNATITGSVTIQPGTYCGNTVLNGGNITLASGLYVIKDGNLTITGSTNVVANGVTFLLTGAGPNFYINSNATLTQTPMSSGQFAGFAFYLDSNANLTACAKASGDSLAKGKSKSNDCLNAADGNATMNVTGIIYLTNTTFVANSSAVVNVTGTFISNLLVGANSATFSLHGAMPSSSAAAAQMQKYSQNGTGTVHLIQ